MSAKSEPADLKRAGQPSVFDLTDEAAVEEAQQGSKQVPNKDKPAKSKRGGTKPDQKKAKGGNGGGPKPAGGTLGVMPAGKPVDTELANLTFLPEMQKRTAIFEEFTVQKYEEHYRERGPTALPPLRCIDVEDGRSIVYDGFQRGEGARRAGLKTVPVIHTKGTEADAEFLALAANAEHGLARSSDDCRRAFYAAIDNEELFKRIDAQKEAYGGLNRALAVACGVSKGSVSNFLRLRGKTIRSGKIVNLPTQPEPPKAKPKLPTGPVATSGNNPPESSLTPEAEAAANESGLFGHAPLTGQALVNHLAATTAEGGMTEAEQMQRIRLTATRVLVGEALTLAAKLGRMCEGLITRDDLGDAMRGAAKSAGIPFVVDENVTSGEFGSNAVGVEKIERWPAVDRIIGVLEIGKAAVADKPVADPNASLPADAALEAAADEAAKAEADRQPPEANGKKPRGKKKAGKGA